MTGALAGAVWGCSGAGRLGEWPASGVAVHSVVTEERPDPVGQALGRLAGLSPEEAQAELPEALAAFRAQRNPDTRLWVLLLLLKAPHREFGDAWALEVLATAAREEGPDPALRNLEALLAHLFSERLAREGALQRAEAGWEKEREMVRALQAALRAAQERATQRLARERAEGAAKLTSLQGALEAEQARVRDLTAQLEQLKTIETILQRREGAVGGKGNP